MRIRDTRTLDLFRDVKPQEVVARFSEEQVRAGTAEGRLARAVAAALKEAKLARSVVAERMSEFLGEDVALSMLDAWASQAKDSHRIPATRLVALCEVLQDARPLNAMLMACGLIAIPAKYEALMRREMALEAKRALEREIESADAEWRAGR